MIGPPGDWPGVQCASAVAAGKRQLEGGAWFDGSKAYRAYQRGEPSDVFDFAEPETVPLAKLPCWEHLDDRQYTM